jgi:hypothetical protein
MEARLLSMKRVQTPDLEAHRAREKAEMERERAQELERKAAEPDPDTDTRQSRRCTVRGSLFGMRDFPDPALLATPCARNYSVAQIPFKPRVPHHA